LELAVRWRQVIVLYVVLGALAGGYWHVTQVPPTRSAGQPARPRFLPVEAEQVDEIQLEREGRALVARREAGGWTVIMPPGAPISAGLIAAFADALAGADEIERLTESDVDTHAAGLDQGAARVVLVARDHRRIALRLGGTNATGTAVYAQRDGAPEIALIGRNVRYYADMIFQVLPGARVPLADPGSPVGG
jgi:hypothetical protein